ncbi:glycerophosphodiester phosphodiesterase [Yaniella halotolerans]|uniref:glycerophosphodiester phosphodiesterase n=1 Tax=Yaniella halotolerans TaxID=225453 RepID=UPI000497F5D7|nr:glycerophosphodiester phosphodiesterase family protein [Yaniella halotolerans]
MKIFAHRGASAQYAEHTRAAFAHALATGVDGIETDVQLSADGHLICWHDATLDRTSSGTGPVRDHRLADLRQLDVTSWKTAQSSNRDELKASVTSPEGQLVTLDQLTQMMIAAQYPVELALEMKIGACAAGVIEEAVWEWLQRWGWNAETGTLMPQGRPTEVSVSIMSFSNEALRRVARAVPSTRLCQLIDSHDVDINATGMIGPSVDWLTDHGALDAWNQTDRVVRMWTVETNEQLTAARRMGVRQITVNDPAWALALNDAASLTLLDSVGGR